MPCGCCCRSISTTSSSRCSASFRSATIRRCWRSLFPAAPAPRSGRFVTYSLLHANLSHIGFNVLWLLPFGSALARRFGAIRFFAFMAVTAVAGALAHLVTHEHAVAPMIGASASVSGTMAAAIRFAFVQGSFLSFSRGDADAAARVPALSLMRALRNTRVLGFSRHLVRRQHHFRHRIDRDRRRRRQRRLAGAYRRIFRRADVVFAVRSGSARRGRCCRCVIARTCRIAADRRLRRKAISFIIRGVMRQGVEHA